MDTLIQEGIIMKTFGIRDLRERSGDLTRTAQSGQMALITCRDKPLLLGVPFTAELLEQGVGLNLAIHLFKNGVITLAKGARIAGLPLVDFIQALGTLGIAVVDYDPDDMESDLENLG
nr:UPF0175 family protein [Endozoicomonas sp.]